MGAGASCTNEYSQIQAELYTGSPSAADGPPQDDACDDDCAPLREEDAFALIKVDELAERGCAIEKTEDRGITIRQLLRAFCYVKRHCVAERWRSSNPGAPHAHLHPQTINLYDLVFWLVKPATREKRCSYVELVASAGTSQAPRWFVSHWWGEPVNDFIACLNKHSSDRFLDRVQEGEGAGPAPHWSQQDTRVVTNPVAYWVCAYANNQWELGGDVSADPANSSFRKAMSQAEGTLTVLDKAAVTYTRVWCAYEIFVSFLQGFQTKTEGKYLYDIYTAHGSDGKPVGICDGTAPVDNRPTTGTTGHRLKELREATFPLDAAEQVLGLRVQDAQASVESDKRHILNAIARAPDLDDAPFAEHDEYEVVNRMLRGRFANSVWQIALPSTGDNRGNGRRRGHPALGKFQHALRTSGLTEFTTAYGGGNDFCKAEFLSEAIPLAVQHLTLKSTGLEFIGPGLGKLSQLESLKMESSHFKDNDLKALGEGLGMVAGFKSLRLDLINSRVSDSDIQLFARGLSRCRQMTSIQLLLYGSKCGNGGMKALGDALSGMASMTVIDLEYNTSNDFGDEGFEAWGRAMGNMPQLSMLKLRLDQTPVGEAGLRAVGRGLGVGGIAQIDTGCYGVCRLARGLAPGPSRMTKLIMNFGNTGVGDEGLEALADSIGNMAQLTLLHLQLHVTKVGDAGFIALARGVGRAAQLTALHLSLGWTQVGNPGIQALAWGVSNLAQLQQFSIQASGLSCGGDVVRALVQSLEKLARLDPEWRKISCFGDHI